MRVGVCPGVRPEGPTPSVMLSAGGMCSTLFLLQVFRRGGWVFGLLVSQNLPQLLRCAVIYRPLEFHCILLLGELFVQVQA